MKPIIGLMIVAATVFTIRKYPRDPEARGVFVETFTDKRALLIGAIALGVNLFLASRVEGGLAEGGIRPLPSPPLSLPSPTSCSIGGAPPNELCCAGLQELFHMRQGSRSRAMSIGDVAFGRAG